MARRVEVMAVILVLLAITCAGACAQVLIWADTSRPELSTFAAGEKVTLTFGISGLTANASGLALALRIVDESDKQITTAELPVSADNAGYWRGSYTAPSERLGFYRVYVKLSDGSTMAKLGSRPAGFLTYCVVPDPAKRPLYPSDQTFFGMQGGFCSSVDVLPYLGIRWVLGGYSWGGSGARSSRTVCRKPKSRQSRK